MIARAGAGWQTIIADLALILFMVSVAAVGHEMKERQQQQTQRQEQPAPAYGEPIAIYRAGSIPLGEWLAQQAPDPRQRLTILVRFADGDGAGAARRALAMVQAAGAQGRDARILLEPGATPELLAFLAYDDAEGGWHEDCVGLAKGGDGAADGRNATCG